MPLLWWLSLTTVDGPATGGIDCVNSSQATGCATPRSVDAATSGSNVT